MADNRIGGDLEYYMEFVNYGNDKILAVKNLKRNTILVFALYPTSGIIISFTGLLDFFAMRIALMAIMGGGVACAIASDKWFSGNRDHLFLAWLVVTGTGITSLVIGMALVYGVSNMLILVFIAFHAVFIIVILNDIAVRISSRTLQNENGSKVRIFYIVSWWFLIGCVFLLEAMGYNVKSGMAASGFMVAATTAWMGFERLFKLHYAVAYNIEVMNTWNPRQDGSQEE